MGLQCILPSEIVSHILCFLSPRDVIQLRVISKQFHDLTYDHVLWRTLYTNARLPRPPGPFPSQSVHFLEHTLVQSERLARSWTARPMEAISSEGIRFPGLQSFSSIVVCGKWLVGCDSPHKLVAYDLDADAGSHPHQLLWESVSPIESWDACPVVSGSGLVIHVVLNTNSSLGPWKLMEFHVNGDSLHHTTTMNVPTKELGRTMYIRGGHTPFSYIAGHGLIFDAETRSFYEFPRFKSALPLDTITLVMLTNTHVISLTHHVDRTVSHTAVSALFQAFTVPADSRQVHDGTGVLRLTHERVVPIYFQDVDLVRNSIVDPVTGATNIRLLHQFFQGDSLHFSCIDLTLPKHFSGSDAVLPMTIDLQHDVAIANHVQLGLSLDNECQVEFSDDGHARGFWVFGVPDGTSGESLADSLIMRFAIDASRDRCVATLGQISMPRRKEIEYPSLSQRMLFDCVGGRLCYDRSIARGVGDDKLAVVINIK